MCSWPGHANLQGSRARLSLGPIWAHRANISLAPSLPFILLLTQGPFWRLTQPRPCLTQGFSSAMSWAPHLIILSKPVSFVLLWALTSVTILLLLKCLERILKWVRGCGKEEGKMNEFWETRPKGSASRRLTTCSSHSAPGISLVRRPRLAALTSFQHQRDGRTCVEHSFMVVSTGSTGRSGFTPRTVSDKCLPLQASVFSSGNWV